MLHRNTAGGWRADVAMQHGRVQWCSELATPCRVTRDLSVIWVNVNCMTEVTQALWVIWVNVNCMTEVT